MAARFVNYAKYLYSTEQPYMNVRGSVGAGIGIVYALWKYSKDKKDSSRYNDVEIFADAFWYSMAGGIIGSAAASFPMFGVPIFGTLLYIRSREKAGKN